MQRHSLLVSHRERQRSVGRDPIPACVRPASNKQPGMANLDRVITLPRLVSVVHVLSLLQKVAQGDPAPVLPQQYTCVCVCVCMNVFKRRKFRGSWFRFNSN